MNWSVNGATPRFDGKKGSSDQARTRKLMMAREISLNERDVQASLSLLKMMGLPHTRTAALLRSGGSAQWLSVRNKAMAKELTIEDLRQHFDKPIAEAAFNFGICTTLLKKICRKIGVKRWPCRQIRSLTKTIRALELQLTKTHAFDERLRLTEQIEELMEKHAAIVKDPSAGGRLGQTLRRKVLSSAKRSSASSSNNNNSSSSNGDHEGRKSSRKLSIPSPSNSLTSSEEEQKHDQPESEPK